MLTDHKIDFDNDQMKELIYKPIFIVGCGRSGTTIFNDILSWHKDLAWFSTYSVKYYSRWEVSACLCKFYRSNIMQHIFGRRWPEPDEGHLLWDWCQPVDNSPNDPALAETDVNAVSISRCRKLVNDHIRYAGKKRFINKNTRNSRRIRYLNKIFPDSLFIHILRDGRAVAASLLNVRWWKYFKPWFMNDSRSENRETANGSPEKLAAQVWLSEVSKVLEDKDILDPNRYLEIKYEDFVSEPVATMAAVCDFCELDWTPDFEQHVKSIDIRNMNDRYKERLTREQIIELNQTIKELSDQLGYRLD